MILHFIFVVKEEELQKRKPEFEYVQKMAKFFKFWIKEKFGQDFEIQCDELITKPTNIFQKLDTPTLIRDHQQRGKDIYHFYLSHFKPFWTDCSCDGYCAENFGMVWWQSPQDPHDELFMAEKNCTTVSHVIGHEMLRRVKHKKFMEEIHDIWSKHIFSDLYFEQYGHDFKKTDEKPTFLAIDTSELVI